MQASLFDCHRMDGDLTVSEESTELRCFPTTALPEFMLWSHGIGVEDAVRPDGAPFIGQRPTVWPRAEMVRASTETLGCRQAACSARLLPAIISPTTSSRRSNVHAFTLFGAET